MIDIIYITYHIDNLKFSLKALQDLNYEFNLVIHNDNPNVKLTKEWLLENCELDKIKYNKLTILNEDKNVGMLFSRINSFRAIENSEYTLFMDDDDYLLIKELPNFTDYVYYRYDAIFLNKEEGLENAMNGVGSIRISPNIAAAFWKSSVLNEMFKVFENNRLDFNINSREDFLIQQIAHAYCLRHDLKFLKHINKIGQIYTMFKSTNEKYDHISDERYVSMNVNPIENYNNIITDYCVNLRKMILTS